jgi:hypothetical protein
MDRNRQERLRPTPAQIQVNRSSFSQGRNAKFAVDRKVEQRPVTHSAFTIQEKPN